MVVEIRRVEPDDWQELREARLAALKDAPTAFGSTYEESAARSDASWRERLEGGGPMFLAYLDGRRVGLSGGYVEEGSHELVSMWVDPASRGQRVGEQLIAVVIAWARADGASALHLWVTEGNDSAQKLYSRIGFVATGERQPLPSDPTLNELGMSLTF